MLSQWVGEAEKQLRLLFDEASRLQPSIIFFDEIDGLAPVRSSKQDYIHASIVSTLLALMDGLDSRGQVILIGATNRIDSLDAALRRPGRFDREIVIGVPDTSGRRQILDIHARGMPLGDDVDLEVPELINNPLAISLANYIWTGPNGFIANGPTASIPGADFGDAGVYTMEVTFDGLTCLLSTADFTLDVHEALPTFDAPEPQDRQGCVPDDNPLAPDRRCRIATLLTRDPRPTSPQANRCAP